MADPAIAFTPDNLAAVTAALARGVLHVQFADRSISYASIKELLELRALMLRSLSLDNRTYRLAATSKGV